MPERLGSKFTDPWCSNFHIRPRDVGLFLMLGPSKDDYVLMELPKGPKSDFGWLDVTGDLEYEAEYYERLDKAEEMP